MPLLYAGRAIGTYAMLSWYRAGCAVWSRCADCPDRLCSSWPCAVSTRIWRKVSHVSADDLCSADCAITFSSSPCFCCWLVFSLTWLGDRLFNNSNAYTMFSLFFFLFGLPKNSPLDERVHAAFRSPQSDWCEMMPHSVQSRWTGPLLVCCARRILGSALPCDRHW